MSRFGNLIRGNAAPAPTSTPVVETAPEVVVETAPEVVIETAPEVVAEENVTKLSEFFSGKAKRFTRAKN